MLFLHFFSLLILFTAQRKRKRDETEEFFSKPTVELQSITLRWNQHILRDELVQWCWEKFQREKVVLLSSPAGSGKTVLMKLFAAAYGNTINLVELDFTNPQTPAELLLGVGIDVNAPRECQINQETIIMVDDVQAKYSDTGFWTYFLKSVLPKLPLTVRFLLSATHILQAGPNPSPANFSEFSRLKIADFKLSNSQCETVLDLAAKAVGLSHVFKEYLKFRRCIVLESQGLVGAIRVAVKATYDHFHGHGDFSEEDAFGFYFSSKYDEYLGRCFSGGFMQLPHNAPLLRSLRECLVHTKLGVRKFLSSLGAESQKLFYQMMAAGIITEKDGYVEFTSQLAQRYFCYLLFSNRSADPSPLSFGKAIIQALRNISAYSLSQSVIPEPDPSFPKEPTFQHLFMDALMAVTPPSARVLCPEFSKIFPTVAGDADDNDNGDGDDDYVQSDFVNADWNVLGKGVEEVKEGVDEAEEGEGSQDDEEKEEEKEGKEKEGTKKINGEIDFYVDGPLRWGFELVVQGREIQEHMKRFRKNTGGKYAPLRMTKYAVIDFRQSKGGKVSNDLKKKQERHRVSVVFEKGGDFRQCQVLLGKSPKIFLVHLSP